MVKRNAQNIDALLLIHDLKYSS